MPPQNGQGHGAQYSKGIAHLKILIHFRSSGRHAFLQPSINLPVQNENPAGTLASSQRLSELALQSGQLGSWSLNVATQTAIRSLRHDQIFGYDQLHQGWTYFTFLNHVDPQDRPRVAAKYRKALETAADWEFEARIHRVDGQQRWIWARGKHLRDDNGNALKIVGLVGDITERRQTEIALRKSEQLAAVGRLASTIAHEMNNPLESVTNLLYLAGTSTDIVEIKQYIAVAETELQRVSSITNQTLRFHRGKPALRKVSALELPRNNPDKFYDLVVQLIHDRMTTFLEPQYYAEYLAPTDRPPTHLLRILPSSKIRVTRIGEAEITNLQVGLFDSQ